MNGNAFLSLKALLILCCFDGSFTPAMNQYTELEELKAILATQELLTFEGTGISEFLGNDFNKTTRFQKPTIVNKIEQREGGRIPKKKTPDGETILSFSYTQNLLRILFSYFSNFKITSLSYVKKKLRRKWSLSLLQVYCCFC